MASGNMANFSPLETHSGDAAKSMSDVKRVSNACQRCRTKHKKCDIGTRRDICTTCEQANAACVGGGPKELRVRFSKFNPSELNQERDSRYLEQVPGQVVFDSMANIPTSSTAHTETQIQSTQPPCSAQEDIEAPVDVSLVSGAASLLNSQPFFPPSPTPADPATSFLETQPSLSPDASTPEVLSAVTSLSNPSPTSYEGPQGQIPPNVVGIGSICYSPMNWSPDSTSSHSLQSSQHTFEVGSHTPPVTEEEAVLIKHFFDILVHWFDYCDPRTHFKSYIRSAIPGDSTVLYAILAISSRHREITAGLSGCKSVEYEQRCLEDLIPSLTDSTKTMPGRMLVSALLLRLLNEMTEPTDAGLNSTHAVTAPVLMQIQKGNLQSSSLSDAAMIVALRQEIFIANMTERVIGPIADCCGIETALDLAPVATWTYRIIALAAHVTNFAYGDDKGSYSTWNQLWRDVHDWNHHQPESFRPIYSNMDCQVSESFLYKIIYAYDCPIAAQQYFQLCRILLLAHDPQVSSLGIGHTLRRREREGQIREAVRIICSVAVSNPECTPARLTAGLAIAMCGELFTEPHQTIELLRIVSAAELHLGWPSLKVSHKLQTFWNLQEFNL